ncbi:MAG TPA: RNA polymerase sigma-70 factor [Puia sp.]|jgi:RNA polymerase sigma-70 factor (ECF subfamily)
MSSYSSLSDFQLAELLRTEGEPVFRFLYERYWNKIYVIARHRLNDRQEAEEVVQDIFTRLWRRRSSLTLTKGFDNYFAVAAKFEVINRLAKNARATAFERDIAYALSAVDETTLRQLDYNELQEKFQLEVNALPEKCRIVFRLQHDQGYTQQQIADELNVSTRTVEAHLAKARRILRGAFGNFLGLLL